ncbi:MAG: patatin-like phospholipase family protein [Acholeplasmataceae bacterium]
MGTKIGLALGGGGARGSYQIGILRALEESDLLKAIHHVSGTSIGAINTLMVMARLNYDRMIDIWKKIDNADIYGDGVDRFKKDRLGLFSVQDLYESLMKEITLSEIRNSKVKGYATAAKIRKETLIEQIMFNRMKKKVFDLNNYKNPFKAVLASASVPVLFGSTKLEDGSYVDGGVLESCPVEPLIENDCDVVLAVPIDFRPRHTHFRMKTKLIVDFYTHYLFRTIPYDILDFKPTIVEENAEYGYHMGNLMLDKLRKKGYLDGKKWKVPKENTHIDITKEEEKELRKRLDQEE